MRMPSTITIAVYLLVVGAGASLAFQQVLNANLRVAIGSPWWAGFGSYLGGMLVMLAVASLAPGPRLSLAADSKRDFRSA
jgi:transporter family-2 protein